MISSSYRFTTTIITIEHSIYVEASFDVSLSLKCMAVGVNNSEYEVIDHSSGSVTPTKATAEHSVPENLMSSRKLEVSALYGEYVLRIFVLLMCTCARFRFSEWWGLAHTTWAS